MAKPKTSAERSRDEAEQAQLDDMLGGAFGGIEQLSPEEARAETPSSGPEPTKGPPSGPPAGPPKGPPAGPPSAPPRGPPKGPPSGPPGGPPSGPPADNIPEATVEPSPEPPAAASAAEPSEVEPQVSAEADEPLPPSNPETSPEPTGGAAEKTSAADPLLSAASSLSKPEPEPETLPTSEADAAHDPATAVAPPAEASSADASTGSGDQATLDLLAEKEAELERLHMENARLRQSVVGASEVIEQMEEPPMPPVVEENIVIPSHVVSDFVRIGRQLDREHLVRATMGSVAMLHPEQPNIMISSRHMTPLPRMNERSLCTGFLGAPSPRGAPSDWHALEVVLASVSVVTGGPAAVIHMHGPHTTAASSEKDLIVLNPIDEVGRQHIGKIVIVDPDPEHPEDFLRQLAEALQQGGMRCVVVRKHGAYAVGADFDQAWANAAMLEHSMQVHLLARQANLKL